MATPWLPGLLLAVTALTSMLGRDLHRSCCEGAGVRVCVVIIGVALWAGLAGAAKPDFPTVLQRFPAATVPYVIQSLGEPGRKLSADEVDVLGVLRSTSPQLEPLMAFRHKLKKGQTRALYPVAAITRGELKVLALRFDDLSASFESSQTFLLAYDSKGHLLGGLCFHAAVKGELISETNVSTLNFIGVASRMRHVTRPLTEAGLPAALVVHSEARAKLTVTGALEEMAPSYATRTGAYVDAATGEELRVFDARIFHRANAKASFTELESDGSTARFKGAEKPYVLTWNDRRSAISAQTPTGAVQLFTRIW